MTFQVFQQRVARVTCTVTRPSATGVMTNYTYVWEQNRMRIRVSQGGQQFGNAHVEVMGVPLADMNQISRLWLEPLTPQNTDSLLIETYDGKAFTPLFQGIIAWSAVDGSEIEAGTVKLVIDANAALPLGNTPAAPYANAGPVSVKDVLTSIAALADFTVDYAPSAAVYQVTDVRLTGSPLQQIAGLMRQFHDLVWQVRLQQIVVFTPGAPITSDPVRIAVDTGLMKAPTYSTSGLQFETVFNPLLRPGIALDVETLFDFVNRTKWVARVINHELDANWPGGVWKTSCAANSYGAKNN